MASIRRIEPTLRARIWATAILAASVWPGSLFGQFNSSVQGVVTDPEGRVVPAATVKVLHEETGVARVVTTNIDGFYRAPNLAPGRFTVEASATGFQAVSRTGIEVSLSSVVRVDLPLALATVQQTVTVTSGAPSLETEQGRISGRLESQEIRQLPIAGRNLMNLVALNPGVIGRGRSTVHGGGSGLTGSDSFAGELQPEATAGGMRSETNSFSVNDSSVDSVARGGVLNITPSPDSIQEVRVVINNFSATDGQGSGAQVQILTKTGTNQFHGGASHYFQNNTLSVRNVFESTIPAFRRNLFSYEIGGPIVRNRSFFFHSFEGIRASGTRTQIYAVETKDFRNFVLQSRPGSIAARVLQAAPPAVDPWFGFRDLGSPRPGVNVIGPADGISDIGNVSFAPAARRSGEQWSLRLDHELRPAKDRLSGTFYRTTTNKLTGTIRPAVDRATDENAVFATVTHTHIVSHSKLNELRAGAIRLLGQPLDPPRPEIPTLNIPQVVGISIGNFPAGWGHTTYTLKDVFSWTTRRHQIKFGGELIRRRANVRNTQSFIPVYAFASILDFADDEPLQMNRNVDPRTGEPASNSSGDRVTEWALFLNDDWKATPNLTLTLGLRSEYLGTRTEVNGLLRGFLFGTGDGYAERMRNGRADMVDEFYPASPANLAPRLGLAWNVRGQGNLVLRAGYGISFDRMSTNVGGRYRNNPPLRAVVNLGPQFGTSFTYSLGDRSKPYFGYPVDPGLRRGLDERNGLRGSRVSVLGFDPLLRPAYAHKWFAGVQHRLWRDWVVDLNWLGSAGRRLYFGENMNRFRGDLLDGRFDGFNPSFSQIDIVQSGANSFHNAGSVQLRRNFAAGFSFQSSFTFGKTLSEADEAGGTGNFRDASNRRLDYGPADFDVSRNWTAAGVWEAPWFKNHRGIVAAFLKGWQLSGTMIAQSGLPFSVRNLAPWPRGDFNADGTNLDSPDAPAPGSKTSGWSRQEYLGGVFRAEAFPRPAAGTNGNLGRNTYRGPGFVELNLSAAKVFHVTERVRLRIRIEGFNVLNRVNLAQPVGDLNNANFARSTAAQDPRLLQTGLRVEF